MLKNIISQLTGADGRTGTDPSVFQDPIAMKTDWSPMARGGRNFKSAGLHQVNDQRYEFKPSPMMKFLSMIFFAAGLLMIVLLMKESPDSFRDYLPVGIAAIFCAVGIGTYYSSKTPIVFDRNHGYFCRSREKPELMMDPTRLKRYAPLKRVHALQIISEYCRTKKSSYYSYELNLVLDDGSRLHVIDHGDHLALRTDAETLAKFLDKPLWDASR